MSREGKVTVENVPLVGQRTVGTSAVQMTDHETAVKVVRIKALDGNTGLVYVGFKNSVSASNGYELSAGQEIELLIEDPRKVHLIASALSQNVSWLIQ